MSTEERLARIEQLILMSSKNVLSVKEAALMLDVSESRVRHLVCDSTLPYYRQGKKIYFKKTEIESWMLHTRFPCKAEIERQATTYTALAKR